MRKNTFKLETLFSLFSAVPNRFKYGQVKYYELFQIMSDCTLYLVFKIVSAVPMSFQLASECTI